MIERRILGIDPGTANIGFAVIDQRGTSLTPVWYDCLRTSPREELPVRLMRIATAIRDILEHLSPVEAAMEDLFFGANAQAALSVGQARGVCSLVCAEAGLSVSDYSPAVVKQAVTGYGRADKSQVQRMVQQILGMSDIPRPDHAADAFAVAIAHAGSLRISAANTATRVRS